MKKKQLLDKFELYIPTKVRDTYVEASLATLTEWSRGMTASAVQGGYVPESGKVILEGVVVYTFYAPSIEIGQRLARRVELLAYYLLQDRGEESVLLVHNGMPLLYELDAA